MKICSNCGAQLDDAAKLCNQCGARTEEETMNTENAAESGNIRGNMASEKSESVSSPYYPQQFPMSGLSVASLILAIAGVIFSWYILAIPSILGLIFGILALKQVKRGGYRGYGLAIAGIIISIIILVIYIIAFIMAMVLLSSAFNGFTELLHYF